jgi:ribonuclease P protein component
MLEAGPMFPLTLQKPWQFRQVYRDGEKIDCKYAVLFYYRTGQPTPAPLFGFVASKRLGNAVNRNRAKRLLRVAAGRTAPRVRHNDLWIVMVARAGILKIRSDDLTAEVERKLRDEGVIN